MAVCYSKYDSYLGHSPSFRIINQLDALISQIYSCNETICFGQFLCPSSGVFHCTHSNGICHTGLLTAFEQDPDPDPARKLSANLYDIHHCCVYSKKLLMMDRGTV